MIKRLAVGLGALIGVLLLFIGCSIGVDYAIGQNRLDEVTNITLSGVGGGPDVRAYVARPPGVGPFPAVIMVHEFYGLNQSIIGKAEGLAEEGYLVIAPDTFRGSTTSWIPRAIFQVITTPGENINQDLDTVFAWLAGQPDVSPDRIGVAGFCYGGRASLSYSLHNPRMAVTVIYYGSPVTDPSILAALSGPVLGIFGGADTSIPLQEVYAFQAALNQVGIENEITIYEGQPHAFVTGMPAIRTEGAPGDAWNQMVRFLDRHLKNPNNVHQLINESSYRLPFPWDYYLRLVFEHARMGTHNH